MPDLIQQLDIERCPHCQVDKPMLGYSTGFETTAVVGGRKRRWKVYSCSRCGGVVTAASETDNGPVREMYPSPTAIDEAIPHPAREYLSQAISSLHAPAGSVMLAASAVDAMLKVKGYKEGSLFARIDKAAKDHLITEEMSQWAHEVRLDANEQRHADETAPLPSTSDAERCVDFVQALAQLLFVVPARVRRGREEASSKGQRPN